MRLSAWWCAGKVLSRRLTAFHNHSLHDSTSTASLRDWRLGDAEQVSLAERFSQAATSAARGPMSADGDDRGSRFLKSWMDHLEEHADLRYPDVSDLQLQGDGAA